MSWFSISALVTKSAVSKPVTRLYPFEKREPYAKTRGHIHFEVNTCTFCNICAHKCPTAAIQVDKKQKVWAIDHMRCILCGACIDDCRRGCLSLARTPHAPMLKQEVESFRAAFEPPTPLVPADAVGCCQTEEGKA